MAGKPPSSTSAVTYAFEETVKAVDGAGGGALKITRQPIPSDISFIYGTNLSVGAGTAATPSTNPTMLYLGSLHQLAIGMALIAIQSGTVTGSPVITKIDVAKKMVTLSVAQTWLTGKKMAFQGYLGNPQVNSATGANIEITDMSIELVPFTATVNGATTLSQTITLDSVYGIRSGAESAITVKGIGLDNTTQQEVTGLSYGGPTITVTSNQSLKDNTILTFEGCSQRAVFKAKIKVTKIPKEDLTLNILLDNILTSASTTT